MAEDLVPVPPREKIVVQEGENLRVLLTLRVGEYEDYYRRVVRVLKQRLGTQIQSLVGLKLSCGNQRLPHDPDAILYRAASILRRLVENPAGVKTIRTWYRCKRRGFRVRPPTVHDASGSIIRRLLRILENHRLVNRHRKGLYTSLEGKTILTNAYQK